MLAVSTEPSSHASPADVQATMCATLVDQWVRDGVTHALVAPGSRSTPVALALAARPDIRVDVFHDERSAGFAALGSGLATGRPAVVVCTSGTAAAHLHAAVVEAHLAHVPMLVLTADRPPELRDVGAPQTIDQTKLFGDAVRWFHDPGVADLAAAHTWRSLARHALERTIGVRPGPVHLNVPMREPLVGSPTDPASSPLGAVRPVTAAVRLGTLPMEIDCERGLIVAGRGVDDPSAVEALAAAAGWPVLADPRSGCRSRSGSIAAFDAVLRHEDFAEFHRPDVVLHLGEPPASKVLAQWLAGLEATQVRVQAVDAVTDPSHRITHRVTAPVGEVCRRLAGELRGGSDRSWAERWSAVGAIAEQVLDRELAGEQLTEPSVARVLTDWAGSLVVASSMPIRDVEWFGSAEQRATVFSNRGANGIDGTIATACGIAGALGSPTGVLLGDVALLHDQSSLTALASRGLDLRIVVVDNDGGGIFSFLPQAGSLAHERFEQLFGTPHGTDVVALAQAHGLEACTVTTRTELSDWLMRPGPWLVRVGSTRDGNVEVHRRLNDAVVAALRPG